MFIVTFRDKGFTIVINYTHYLYARFIRGLHRKKYNTKVLNPIWASKITVDK